MDLYFNVLRMLRCLFGVCLMFVWCLFAFVWCLFGVCLVFVWCLFGVCLVFVWCLFGVCLMFVATSSFEELLLIFFLRQSSVFFWMWNFPIFYLCSDFVTMEIVDLVAMGIVNLFAVFWVNIFDESLTGFWNVGGVNYYISILLASWNRFTWNRLQTISSHSC